MSRLSEDLAHEIKLFDESAGFLAVGDDDDNAKFSDNEESSTKLSEKGDDDDGGADDNEGSDAPEEEEEESEEDEEENAANSTDSKDERNENNKRGLDDDDDDEEKGAKKKKLQPTKKIVDGDNISLCFIPIGNLDKDKLCVLGVTLCCVRMITEGSFFNELKRKGHVQPPKDEAEKKIQEKYDFFERQFEMSAPPPMHICQQSQAEYALYKLKDTWKQVAQTTVAALADSAKKAKRCFVYCVAKFANEEEARAHSCPFLIYPMQGKLTWNSPFSTNWQTATEWPNEALDEVNAPLNAALVTEAKLSRCLAVGSCSMACTANQPLPINALFQFNFEKQCHFGKNGVDRPMRNLLKFRQGHRRSAHSNFVDGRLTLTTTMATWTFAFSNFIADRGTTIAHEHGRNRGHEKTTLPTVCEAQFASDKQVAAVLTRHLSKEFVKKKKKSYFLFRSDRKHMCFDDVVHLLRNTNPTLPKFKEIMSLILPATAPLHFWEAVSLIGFDKTVKMAVLGILNQFAKFVNSPCPQITLDSSRFAEFRMADSANFCNSMAARTSSTPDDVKLYAHLSDVVRLRLETFRTEQRFLSRPDVTEGARKLCWPNDPNSSIAAIEIPLAEDLKTTFVSRKYLFQQDIMIAAAIKHGFEKRVRASRSDCCATLRSLLEEQIEDGSFCAIFVNTAADKVYWDEKVKYLPTMRVCMVNDNVGECVRQINSVMLPLDDGEKWNIAFPRADLFSYEKLAYILTVVTTGVESNSKLVNKLSYVALKPSDSAEHNVAKESYKRGCCSAGGTLIVGGLAFQFAEHEQRCGNLVDDLYFSGLVDAQLKERYVTIDKFREEALVFTTSQERLVNKSGESFRLAKTQISFSKHYVDTYNCSGFETIDHINLATKGRKILTLYPNTALGEVNNLAKQKIDQSKSDALPHLVRHDENFGCVAVVFDCVEDDMFFRFRSDQKNLALQSYDYFGIAKELKSEKVDRISEFHSKVKHYVRSGLSLAGMISLQQSNPSAVMVFGSVSKSIEARVSASCEAPWFLTPPSKAQAGRPWHQNSEATELSALCWILPLFWNK